MRWLLAIFVDYLVIALAFAAVWFNPWLAPLAVLVIGNRQHAISILAHDGAHGHGVSDFLTNLLSFWPLGASLSGYRAFHFPHHKWLDTERDPEVQIKKARYNPPATSIRVISSCLAALVGFGLLEISEFLIYMFRRSRPIDWVMPLLLWVGMAVFLPWWVLPLWLLSLATAFWALFRARVWTEHVGGGTAKRSVVPSRWKRLLFLPHNVWCHWEHHRAANIPFHKLRLNKIQLI